MFEVISYSFIIGICAALQGILNREISLTGGLPLAMLINSCVFVILSLLIYMMAYRFPHLFSNFFQLKSIHQFKWWYILPGFFGVLLVGTLPYLIHRGGVQRVFVGLLLGQLFIGIFIDYFKMGIPFSWQKITGSLLAILSVILLASSK